MIKRIIKYAAPAVMACFASAQLSAQYNYNDVLEKAVWFYDANKCGPDAGQNNVFSWRGACHVNDGSTDGVDLSGGFHDAGDHVKFGLPQAWSAATLGWALYEYPQAFESSGSKTKLLGTLKHFSDYFIRSHTDADTFYYQVGDGDSDHAYWGPPEDQPTARPTVVARPSAPASEMCGQTAAALALMYLNYKDIDSAYAQQCRDTAISLYELGVNNLGRGSDGTSNGQFYNSSSHFDDLAWGGVWLSIATGDTSYLDPIEGWLDIGNDHGDDNYNKRWAPAWDDVNVFVMLKMYELTGTTKYRNGVLSMLNFYRDDLARTPGGLPYLSPWGVLRYASCVAGVGYLAADKLNFDGYLATGNDTIDYILGDNPRNSSYVTGWGNNPPEHPHHRANQPDYYYPNTGNTLGLIGGLVGGPKNDDSFVDDVGDFQRTEVGLDYNASFILGLAGRIARDGSGPSEFLSASPSNITTGSAASTQSVIVSSNLSWAASDNRSWISLSPASGSNDGSLTVSISAHSGTSNRSGTITLTGGDITRTISVTQNGVAANQAPNANAGSDITVTDSDNSGSETVTLNGSASSDDNGVTSYQWSESGASIGSGASPSVAFTVGVHTVTLTVSDAAGLTDSDTVTVRVNEGSSGSSCDSPDTVSLPFEHDGSGDYCWFTTGTIDYINSWHAATVAVNGVDITNDYTRGRDLPARVDGGYYIQFSGARNYSHVEIIGSGGDNPVTYSLTTNVTGNGSITRSPNASTYNSGATVELTANPAAGYSFVRWEGAATGSSNPVSLTMGGNRTVTAVFEADDAPTPSNVALGASVTTTAAQSPNIGSRIVDGTNDTDDNRWSANGFPQTATLNLGGAYSIDRVSLFPYRNRAYQYRVEVADNAGGPWTTVVNRLNNTTGGNVITDTITPTEARYLRITVEDASGYSGSWTSIRELEVYGVPAN